MSDPRIIRKAFNEVFFKYLRNLKDQKGVALVLVAIMIVMLLGFVALAIDVGLLMVARNELQNIADGAALAACGELGAIYRSLPFQDQAI
jgi:Flp pilus assembly protein TadG